MVPDGDLEAAVGEVVEADALVGHGVLPLGAERSATDGSLLLARLVPVGEKITEKGNTFSDL